MAVLVLNRVRPLSLSFLMGANSPCVHHHVTHDMPALETQTHKTENGAPLHFSQAPPVQGSSPSTDILTCSLHPPTAGWIEALKSEDPPYHLSGMVPLTIILSYRKMLYSPHLKLMAQLCQHQKLLIFSAAHSAHNQLHCYCHIM